MRRRILSGEDSIDVLGAGWLALLAAVRDYWPGAGATFATFAHHVVMCACRHAVWEARGWAAPQQHRARVA